MRFAIAGTIFRKIEETKSGGRGKQGERFGFFTDKTPLTSVIITLTDCIWMARCFNFMTMSRQLLPAFIGTIPTGVQLQKQGFTAEKLLELLETHPEILDEVNQKAKNNILAFEQKHGHRIFPKVFRHFIPGKPEYIGDLRITLLENSEEVARGNPKSVSLNSMVLIEGQRTYLPAVFTKEDMFRFAMMINQQFDVYIKSPKEVALVTQKLSGIFEPIKLITMLTIWSFSIFFRLFGRGKRRGEALPPELIAGLAEISIPASELAKKAFAEIEAALVERETELQNRLSALQREQQNLRSQIEQEVTRRTTAVSEKEKRLTTLEEELDQRKADITNELAQLTERQTEIRLLSEDLQTRMELSEELRLTRQKLTAAEHQLGVHQRPTTNKASKKKH